MITHIARQVEQVIAVEGELPATSPAPGPASPPHTPHKATPQEQRERAQSSAPQLIPLIHFIFHVVKSANVQVATLLTTLIYLQRLREKLPAMATGKSTPSWLSWLSLCY